MQLFLFISFGFLLPSYLCKNQLNLLKCSYVDLTQDIIEVNMSTPAWDYYYVDPNVPLYDIQSFDWPLVTSIIQPQYYKAVFLDGTSTEPSTGLLNQTEIHMTNDPIFGEACVLTVESSLHEKSSLDKDDIHKWLEGQDLDEFPEGCIAVINFGWATHFGKPDYINVVKANVSTMNDTELEQFMARSPDNYTTRFPTIDQSAVDIFIKANIRALLVDTPGIDSIPGDLAALYRLLGAGIPVVINLSRNIAKLSDRYSQIMMFPIYVPDISVAPVRVSAYGVSDDDICSLAYLNSGVVCPPSNIGKISLSGKVLLVVFPSLFIGCCLFIRIKKWKDKHGG